MRSISLRPKRWPLLTSSTKRSLRMKAAWMPSSQLCCLFLKRFLAKRAVTHLVRSEWGYGLDLAVDGLWKGLYKLDIASYKVNTGK